MKLKYFKLATDLLLKKQAQLGYPIGGWHLTYTDKAVYVHYWDKDNKKIIEMLCLMEQN